MSWYYVLLGWLLGAICTVVGLRLFSDPRSVDRRVNFPYGQREKVDGVLSWLRNGGSTPAEAKYRLNALGVPYARSIELLKPRGCGKRLAAGQWWSFCGETDMGQTTPALCEKCDREN